MASLDAEHQKLCFKIAYCGSSLSGKATNLRQLQQCLGPRKSASLETIEFQGGQFCTRLDLEMGSMNGYAIEATLHTLPEPFLELEAGHEVLRAADGIVFVADSQRGRYQANLDCMHRLQSFLRILGSEQAQPPCLLQLNKRDLPDCLSLDRMLLEVPFSPISIVRACATEGRGVEKSFRSILKAALRTWNAKSRALNLRSVERPLPLESLIWILRTDPDSDRRAEALGALENHLSSEQAFQALLQALEDASVFVRLQAITTLAKFGRPEAVEALYGVANDRAAAVQIAAREALARLGHGPPP